LELLQASLADLVATNATDLPDEQVREGVAALVVASNQVMALLATYVGVFDARGLAEIDGFRKTRTWLVAYGRMSQGAATGVVKRSQLLPALPAMASAAGRGKVSAEHLSKVDTLAHRVGLKEVAEFDEILADLSSAAGPAETQKACERIAAHLDPDGAKPDPVGDYERREVTFSRVGSMFMMKGQLDADGGAALMTAVDALMQPPGPDDTRTAAQRRADALVELARQALVRGELPSVGGVRPQVGILLTPTALLGLPAAGAGVQPQPAPSQPAPSQRGQAQWGEARWGQAQRGQALGRAGSSEAPTDSRSGPPPRDRLAEVGIPLLPEPPWLTWFGDIPIEVAQRIACDSSVWRIVLDPATGLPLDLGRSHRIVPHWIRKALHARDRTCRWPGCDTPVAWTDAHHCELPWYLGGETNVDELVSMCRHHHVLVHEGQWKLTLDHTTGEVHVTRPDGRPYDIGASQPNRPRTP
jgi:hypothetical protein